MEKEKYLVSVIVPVYNVEKYLGRCIESILKQTYKNIELILINDGSDDNSLEICNKFSDTDKRIRVIDKENTGVSSTRNLGIELAKGRYLCFIDSDDYVENTYIEKLVCNVCENTVTFCGYFIDTYKDNGDVLSTIRKYQENGSTAVKANLADVFHQGFLSVIWNKMYDVEILRKNEIKFDKKLSLGEDLLFNLEYLKTGIDNFAFVDIPLYHYIKRGKESLDNKYRKDFLNIQEKLFEGLISVSEIYGISDLKKSMIYSDFMGAIIVSADNYYIFNKNDKAGVKNSVRMACESIEGHHIMNNLSGKDIIICRFRYLLLKMGLFKIDFLIREMIKKILGI